MLNKTLILIAGLSWTLSSFGEETLKPLKNGIAPTSAEELGGDYDPRKEPLDTEILKEWEVDGTIIKVIRFRVGIFKGKKAMLAAVYGYPKDAKNLPGLVQIHGAGQFATDKAVIANAKEGYTTVSISWAGRIDASQYRVDNAIKQLYWDGKTDDPKHLVTTDWGGVDAHHAPCRYPTNNFVTNPPSASGTTVDPIKSARNSGWFLAAMAARRAITFLEQQPQVDKNKIGVYGHSMGGKLTVMTAGSDKRVKAAAPSCGGISDLEYKTYAFKETCDENY